MIVLDFKEIPEAHKATGEQDQFELFTRDFLEMSGFNVVSPPGRGADGGKDMIVEEIRRGIAGETVVRWLVSCKHKAHSGKSIGTDDEINILDRVRSKQCHGFIGFYSTLPSSALTTRLEELSEEQHMFHSFYDYGRIERDLLSSPEGVKLAERFFPISFSLWKRNNPIPVKLFSDNEGLRCANCGADLLAKGKQQAIAVFLRRIPPEIEADEPYIMRYQDIYWCCKGDCSIQLKDQYRHQHPDWADSWSDISDLCIPHRYLQLALSTIRSLHEGTATYTTIAIEKRITLLFELFPFVTRELSDNEEEQLRILRSIPSWASGMGE